MEFEIEDIVLDEEFEVGDMEFDVLKIQPELNDLKIIPSEQEQSFKGIYGNVIVDKINTEEKDIGLDFSESDINEFYPEFGKYFKKIVVNKSPELLSKNIKKGFNIYGIEGSDEGIDTSDATANSEDILVGKTAYVNNMKLMGTLPNRVDTEDATVTSADILSGKIAYAKNQQIIGTIEEYDGFFEGSATIEGNATLLTEPSTGSKIHYLIQKIPTINFSGLTNVANFFDGCLNLEEVSLVNTGGLNIINYLFYNCQKLTKIIFPEKPNISQMISAFNNCSKLESVENINTSNCNFFSETFSGCNSLKECPDINTNNATNVYGMFKSCMNLITIPKLYFGKVIRIDYLLNSCSSLQNLGGFEEIGKAFTTKTANNSFYTLDLSYSPLLTHDSLMNVINNLYDLNLTYDVAGGGTLYTQKLSLGSTNLAKLTTEEIQIANDKGWTVL